MEHMLLTYAGDVNYRARKYRSVNKVTRSLLHSIKEAELEVNVNDTSLEGGTKA
jgi:hypothetical protein